MKIEIVILWMIVGLTGSMLKAQIPERYSEKEFPKAKFIVTKREFRLGDLLTTIISATTKTGNQQSNIWIEQQKEDKLILTKLLGQTHEEYGFYLPHPQPLKNYAILVECRESEGLIHLLDTNGGWRSFPGYYFGLAINGQNILTKLSAENEETLYLFNLNSSKGVYKKVSKTGLSRYSFYEIKNTDWIR